MITDLEKLVKGDTWYLVIKGFSLFLVVSVFDPIIFSTISDYTPKPETKAWIYLVFNIGYVLLPLFMLCLILYYTDQWEILKEQKLHVKFIVTILVYAVFVIVFLLAFRNDNRTIQHVMNALIIGFSFICFLIILFCRYHNRSKKFRRIVDRYILAGVIILILAGLTSFNLYSQKKRTSYIEAFLKLQETDSNSKMYKAASKDMSYQVIKYGGSLDSLHKNYRNRVIEAEHCEKLSAIDAANTFKVLFVNIRAKKILLMALMILLSLAFLTFIQQRTNKIHRAKDALNLVTWVYALSLLMLFRPIVVDHVKVKQASFMYYMGNWYAPSAVNPYKTTRYISYQESPSDLGEPVVLNLDITSLKVKPLIQNSDSVMLVNIDSMLSKKLEPLIQNADHSKKRIDSLFSLEFYQE